MNQKVLETLEFPKILAKISAFADSSRGKTAISEIYPMTDADAIRHRLIEVEEADKILHIYAANVSFSAEDVNEALEKASVFSVLTMGELLRIKRMLNISGNIRSNIIKVPDDSLLTIKAKAGRIFTDKNLADDIDAAIISDSEMSDNASPELRQIRQRIRKAGDLIKAKLQSYITRAEFSKVIQDNIVTVRNGRYVIPVKAECRGSVAGLIHDQSSSGQTVYIEPMAVVELNNTLKSHILDEEREIERILHSFTARVSLITEELKESADIIAELDVIFAKAKYAALIKAKKPNINDNGFIKIEAGRHPLINPDKVVPIDISVGGNYDMLFITGPNTGGKTVSLKLTGLFVVMAMSGIFLPAREADIGVFYDVFSDIGDEQSIEQNLSTFSSHIANIASILESLSGRALVLLDELGAGTDPTEGAALAVSISDFVRKSGAKAIVTTHYNELKEYAVVTERVENASMDFDPITYNPTYRLIIGTPGASNAILIARKIGLNETIIEKALAAVKDGKIEFENVLVALETARRNALQNEIKTESLLKEAEEISRNAEKERERLFTQRERLNENVKKETKRLVEEAMSEANEIISTLKALLDEPSEQNLFEARKLRKTLTKYVIDEDNEFRGFGEEADGEIRIGDTVLVKPLKVEGEVVAINKIKNTASVKLGKLNSSFKLSELLKMKSAKKEEFIKSTGTKSLVTSSFSPELNIIGKNVMEATPIVEQFIDSAIVAGVNEIRIIHGHGTGRLREAVQRLLKKHASIESIKDGGYDGGGRGVTVALLKR